MTTSVTQQKKLPKDYFANIKGDFFVSQKWLEKPRVIPQPWLPVNSRHKQVVLIDPCPAAGALAQAAGFAWHEHRSRAPGVFA